MHSSRAGLDEPAGAKLTLLRFLTARSWLPATGAAAAGLVGGACSAGLVALINTGLYHAHRSPLPLFAGFAVLISGKIASHAVARLLLNRFTQQTLSDLSRHLSRQVLDTPLPHLESMGLPRILTVLTEDVAMIGWTAQNLPSLASNLAVLAGCATYLGWLSWQLLLAVTLTVTIGAVCHASLSKRAYRHLQQARDTRDVLFGHFRALADGIKELKLHAKRREAFLVERIGSTTEALRLHALAGLRHHLVADTWSQLLFYGLLAGLLLVATTGDLPPETATGYLLAMLYLMSPVWGLIETWPILARGRIALDKVEQLGLSLAAGVAERTQPAHGRAPRDWHRLDFDGVTFRYPSDVDGAAFALGPIDFTLRRGELVFLVGGNGSGKSTFVKVLTGLYAPQAGEIRLDGLPVGDDTRQWYRQHFSAVFSDFYLFDGLLGLDGDGIEGHAHRWLVELELDAKVQIRDGIFSTTALSQGQRKRLALLTAFLEDRPIYVFDEWAADQDAHYREIFYRRLLPELRSRGKTVVVISHDDRYYELGDRIVKLEEGRLVDDLPVSCEAGAAE